MNVTAWNNGSNLETGAGYGIKIDRTDRDHYFKREWGEVLVQLDDTETVVRVNIDKESFWNDECRELISADIGRWLLANKLAPWVKDSPPKLNLEALSENLFFLKR